MKQALIEGEGLSKHLVGAHGVIFLYYILFIYFFFHQDVLLWLFHKHETPTNNSCNCAQEYIEEVEEWEEEEEMSEDMETSSGLPITGALTGVKTRLKAAPTQPITASSGE